MKILVDRVRSNDFATISEIIIDDKIQCYGLEDDYDPVKEQNKTRIPGGTYNIILRNAGGMNVKYTRRFADHKGMLWLQNVPNYTYVYIHCGNTVEHTAGCLLVGTNYDKDTWTISNSVRAYIPLYKKIVDAAEDNSLQITFRDTDLINADINLNNVIDEDY